MKDTIFHEEAFPDEFGIGQRKVARIRAEISQEQMGRFVEGAFSVGYVPQQWREMCKRQFYQARDEYEKAKRIMEGASWTS